MIDELDRKAEKEGRALRFFSKKSRKVSRVSISRKFQYGKDAFERLFNEKAYKKTT